MVNNVIPVSATCLLMEIALMLQRSYNYTNIGAERFELPDPLVPNQMRYQAALRPDFFTQSINNSGKMQDSFVYFRKNII